MKEITGKAKHSIKFNFLPKLKIGKKIKTGEDEIANKFNKYFADIGPSWAKDIPNPSIRFESFLRKVNTTLLSQSLSINELKDAFFSLKTNKIPGADERNFNVMKHCFGELCGPLKYLFDSSLQSRVFPDLMKIALVSPVFKTGDTVDISIYSPISVLSFFSKILERLMYNRLNWSESITPTTVWFPKRPVYRTCNCSACGSDLWNICERQLHRWHFCRLVKGVWYSRSYNTFEKAWDLWENGCKSCLV